MLPITQRDEKQLGIDINEEGWRKFASGPNLSCGYKRVALAPWFSTGAILLPPSSPGHICNVWRCFSLSQLREASATASRDQRPGCRSTPYKAQDSPALQWLIRLKCQGCWGWEGLERGHPCPPLKIWGWKLREGCTYPLALSAHHWKNKMWAEINRSKPVLNDSGIHCKRWSVIFTQNATLLFQSPWEDLPGVINKNNKSYSHTQTQTQTHTHTHTHTRQQCCMLPKSLQLEPPPRNCCSSGLTHKDTYNAKE